MGKKTLFIAGLILTVFTVLEFYRYQAAALFFAQRASLFGELPLSGINVAIENINLQTPLYYYLIALLYFFLKSEIGISLVFAFSNYLYLLLIFLTAKTLFHAKAALLAFFFAAFAFNTVNYGRYFWEPHLIPLLIAASFYFLVKANLRHLKIYYLLAYISFGFSLMYLSSWLFLPALLFLTVKAARSRFKPLFHLLVTFFVAYLPVIFYEFQTGYSLAGIPALISGRTPFFSFDVRSIISSTANHAFLFLASFLGNDFSPIFLLAVAVGSVYFSGTQNRKKIAGLYLVIFSGLALSGLYQGIPAKHRLNSLFPFFCLTAGYLTWTFFKTKLKTYQSWTARLAMLSFIFVFLQYNSLKLAKLYFTKNAESLDKAEKISDYILSSAQSEDFTLATVLAGEMKMVYNVNYYFLLEKETGRKLVKLNDTGNWTGFETDPRKRWLYLICREIKNRQEAQKVCLDYYRTRFGAGEPDGYFQAEDTGVFKILQAD